MDFEVKEVLSNHGIPMGVKCPCDNADRLVKPCYSWEESRICVCLDIAQDGRTPS